MHILIPLSHLSICWHAKLKCFAESELHHTDQIIGERYSPHRATTVPVRFYQLGRFERYGSKSKLDAALHRLKDSLNMQTNPLRVACRPMGTVLPRPLVKKATCGYDVTVKMLKIWFPARGCDLWYTFVVLHQTFKCLHCLYHATERVHEKMVTGTSSYVQAEPA